MRLIKDLVISRKELVSPTDNILWTNNGCLFMTTSPEISMAKPIYTPSFTSIVNPVAKRVSSRQIFHIEDMPINIPNKFDNCTTLRNSLLNSQPNSFVRIIKSNNQNVLALLTSNSDCYLYNTKLNKIIPIDCPDDSLYQRSYHSVQWLNDDILLVGNETGELLYFDTLGNLIQRITINDDKNESWVTKISVFDNNIIIVCLHDNSIYCIIHNNVTINDNIFKIKDSDRFLINDLSLFNNYLVISTIGKIQLFKIDFEQMTKKFLDEKILINNNGIDEFFIIKFIHSNFEKFVLLSNQTSFTLTITDDKLVINDDNIIGSQLEKKFKKWNQLHNEYGKYESTILINGISLSNDGYSLAIAYSIERISIKYRIVSESIFRIMFLPLYDEWDIDTKKSLGMAWYQNFLIYNNLLPKSLLSLNLLEQQQQSQQNSSSQLITDFHNNIDINDSSLSKKDNIKKMFKNFLNNLLIDPNYNLTRFNTFISNNNDPNPSLLILYSNISNFLNNIIEKNYFPFENWSPTDKATFIRLQSIIGNEIDPNLNTLFEIKTNWASEVFDMNQNSIQWLNNKNDIKWGCCSVTLLPVLNKCKVCPVTDCRVLCELPIVEEVGLLQEEKDESSENSISWLDETLLEVFDQSPAAGAQLVFK